jgi:antitoxin component of RelBE/YafQ-DinJ toxin-antitoxin module
MNSMGNNGRVSLMASTPLRSFRISDEVYYAAQAKAQADGLTVTDVVVYWLAIYAAGSVNAEA